MVSFDVSRAFDSINVSRLLDLVEPLLRQREYLLVKYVEVRTVCLQALLWAGEGTCWRSTRCTVGGCIA